MQGPDEIAALSVAAGRGTGRQTAPLNSPYLCGSRFPVMGTFRSHVEAAPRRAIQPLGESHLLIYHVDFPLRLNFPPARCLAACVAILFRDRVFSRPSGGLQFSICRGAARGTSQEANAERCSAILGSVRSYWDMRQTSGRCPDNARRSRRDPLCSARAFSRDRTDRRADNIGSSGSDARRRHHPRGLCRARAPRR